MPSSIIPFFIVLADVCDNAILNEVVSDDVLSNIFSS